MKNTFAALFIFVSTLANAQFCAFDSSDIAIVLASNLHLRKEPSVKSKIVANIPFNSRVEIAENFQKVDSAFDKDINSYWIKINYRNNSGYVAENYLGHPFAITDMTTEPMFVRYKYWYKINKTEKGDYLTKTKTQMDTFQSGVDGIYATYEMHETEKKKKEDEYIQLFGTNIRLKEGKIGDFYSALKKFNSTQNPEADNYSNFCITDKAEGGQGNKVIFKFDSRFKNCFLELENDMLYFSNGKQRENILPDYPTEFGLCVEWYGDFDMDGKPDFILYCPGTRYFFLSLLAAPKKLVGIACKMQFEEGD